MNTLTDLLADRYVKTAEIAALLDHMSHRQRLEAIGALSRSHLRDLYHRVRGAGDLDADYFVPSDVPPMTQVIHWGRNSLPTFRSFQKRFCRPDPEATLQPQNVLLWGYNEQEMALFTGPGYFVVRPGNEDDPIVIDYRFVPENKPYGWPEIHDNAYRLSRFIYNNTVDKMRRVSEHVTIGAAYREEQALGAYFILCREDRTTDP
ncbi:MAG: hypothetical protein AAFS10_26985 [Myxococcota bacterium]